MIILNKEANIKALRKQLKLLNVKSSQTAELIIISKKMEQIDYGNISLKKRISQLGIQMQALQK